MTARIPAGTPVTIHDTGHWSFPRHLDGEHGIVRVGVRLLTERWVYDVDVGREHVRLLEDELVCEETAG